VKVRTRFAPSPTGRLHIGGISTALFNYLFAKAHDGTFILRMEDTDRTRSRAEFERSIMADMKWLGLDWNEGPDMTNGGYGPYRQSERLHIYRELAEKLLEKKLAYKCYCSKARLKELSGEQAKAGLPPRYDGRCRGIKSPPNTSKPVLRFIVPDKKIHFNDLIHGPREFNPRAFGDFIILTPDETPTYNFASAVDDGLMEISHVLRGDDHLSNTPRQILLMEALGFKPPVYAHMPLVIGADRKPLGKRTAGADIEGLRNSGFLPMAILNAAARLGWAPGDGLLSLSHMASAFSIKKISKSPAIFDPRLLPRINKNAIKNMAPIDIIKLAGLNDLTKDEKRLYEALTAVGDTASTLKDLTALIKPLLNKPSISNEAEGVLKTAKSAALLGAITKELDNGVMTYDNLIKNIKDHTDFKGRALFMPLRCALTGETKGIELEKIFKIIGPVDVAERVREALAMSKSETAIVR
jgi:glutamyl-tRNA synthetase